MLIDTKALVEFFEAHEGRWDSYDISTADEMRVFLTDFCMHELGVKGREEERDIALPDIYFPNKKRAELVLELLKMEIRRHGCVTVADYYGFAGQKTEATYYDLGWTDMNASYLYSCSFKGETRYGIYLPKPVKLRD